METRVRARLLRGAEALLRTTAAAAGDNGIEYVYSTNEKRQTKRVLGLGFDLLGWAG